MHLFHVRSLQIGNVILLADALGRCVVFCCDELVAGRTLTQARQHVEDASFAVVQQQDTEVSAQVLVPQGILVVEEAQVTNDAEHFVVGHAGETSRCTERPLDAVHAPIAVDTMPCINVGQSDG